jgi:hypothetical protein
MAISSGDKAISDALRDKMDALPLDARRAIQREMLDAFGTNSLRNVQLWTEKGASTRNFINSQLGDAERYRRYLFASAVLAEGTPNRPSKTTVIGGIGEAGTGRLGELLHNRWFNGQNPYGAAISRISPNSDGSLTITYDSDSTNTGEWENVEDTEDPDDDQYP